MLGVKSSQSTVHCRDSPGASSTHVSGSPEVCGSSVWRSFGETLAPSASVTINRAEIPTDTEERETFFVVTIMSNGTPGSTESLASVRVASTACGGAPAAQLATGSKRKRAKIRRVSFMNCSLMVETGPGACGFQGIRNAIRHPLEGGGISRSRSCAVFGPRHRYQVRPASSKVLDHCRLPLRTGNGRRFERQRSA